MKRKNLIASALTVVMTASLFSGCGCTNKSEESEKSGKKSRMLYMKKIDLCVQQTYLYR